MENDYRVMNIVSLEMDRDDAEASAESTLSNSFEFGLTVDNSRGDADSKLVTSKISFLVSGSRLIMEIIRI